jgi:hypothetical protein
MKKSSKPVAYIAGPYRSDTEHGVVENIRNAEYWAIELWKLGFAVICPHKNTALLGGVVPDTEFLAGDVEIMQRVDLVYALPEWESSAGAYAEVMLAMRQEMSIAYNIMDARRFLALWGEDAD